MHIKNKILISCFLQAYVPNLLTLSPTHERSDINKDELFETICQYIEREKKEVRILLHLEPSHYTFIENITSFQLKYLQTKKHHFH
jgi:hypothetical protein